MTAIYFAFACLVFTALNDLLFKFYARKPRPRGLFFSIIGIFWFLTVISGYHTPENWNATLLWGVISGLASVISNLMLVIAMSRLSAGLCSTIFRLNMVVVVLFAACFFGETLTGHQTAGVLLAACAVIAFLPFKQQNRKDFAFGGFLIVLSAAVLRAGMALSYRYAFTHGADRNLVVIIDSLFWVAGGALYWLMCEKDRFKLDRKLWFYGIVSGLLITGITVTMAFSLQYGNASIVCPIAQMSFLLTALLGILILKEKLTIGTILALACGVGAIVLLSIP